MTIIKKKLQHHCYTMIFFYDSCGNNDGRREKEMRTTRKRTKQEEEIHGWMGDVCLIFSLPRRLISNPLTCPLFGYKSYFSTLQILLLVGSTHRFQLRERPGDN